MLFQLPDDQVLYDALLKRDPSYEGIAWVGVTSTGIFCRLSCTARKPKAENCRFFDNIADCLDAGFRPCRRCRPLHPISAEDPLVSRLLAALEEDPTRRWREADIQQLGLDPSTVRRTFKRHYGMTFLEMARLRRLRSGMEQIAQGSAIIDAQQQAGFDSASGFRQAIARLTGQPPSSLSKVHKLCCGWVETPLGPMIAVADEKALHLLEFHDRKGLPGELKRLQAHRGPLGIAPNPLIDQISAELKDYFSGAITPFQTPCGTSGSPPASAFTRSVWDALRAIPAGETRSYGALARQLGRPGSSRAVARANGANTLSIVVPCHRVIGADGSLTGYGGGLWRKQWLLEHERVHTARRARQEAS
ncbi:MAG: trifunctional transcriptional activator/DNA repair protein Ada/methylated-DNA--[protein]-cysteine S-methyltransferase [Pseudomonadota bacterium]